MSSGGGVDACGDDACGVESQCGDSDVNSGVGEAVIVDGDRSRVMVMMMMMMV